MMEGENNQKSNKINSRRKLTSNSSLNPNANADADLSWRSIVKSRNTLNVVQLGVGFFFIFVAFNSQSFIEESVIDYYAERNNGTEQIVHKHDGYTSLFIIYIAFTLLNLLAAPIIGYLGPRWSLVFASLAYAIFQAGFLFLNKWYLYASSVLVGFGAAVLWTAHGKYIALNSNEQTAGLYAGLSNGIGQSSNIFGGIFLLTIFLVTGHHSDATITYGSAAEMATGFTRESVQILYGTFTAITLVGVLILAFLRMPPWTAERGELHSSNHGEVLNSTFKMAFTPRMALFAVVSLHTGVFLSFWSSIYPTSLINTLRFHTDHGLNPKVLLAINAICQGIGESSGCILLAIFDGLTRKFGRIYVVAFGSILHLICFLGVYLNLPSMAPLSKTNADSGFMGPNVFLALACGLLLGFGIACWKTEIYSHIIVNYPMQSAQVFALFQFYSHLSTFSAFYYSKSLSLPCHLGILSIGTLVACFAFWAVECLKWK